MSLTKEEQDLVKTIAERAVDALPPMTVESHLTFAVCVAAHVIYHAVSLAEDVKNKEGFMSNLVDEFADGVKALMRDCYESEEETTKAEEQS